jgi:hypothetical protein
MSDAIEWREETEVVEWSAEVTDARGIVHRAVIERSGGLTLWIYDGDLPSPGRRYRDWYRDIESAKAAAEQWLHQQEGDHAD